MSDSKNSMLQPDVEQTNTATSSVPTISLYLLAFALLLTDFGDIQSYTSHGSSWSFIWKMLVANAIIWWVNADIASYLKRIFVSEQTGIAPAGFRFNYIAVVAMGICMVVTCFNIDEDSVLGVIFGLAMLVVSLCWLVAQALVAVNLISKGVGLLGASILAYVAVLVVTMFVLADLSFKHNEATFYVLYALEFITSMLMYTSYKKYFKTLNNNE